jgi:hypothetical protein
MGMLSHAVVNRDDGAVMVHLHPMGSISMAAQQMFEARAGAGKMGGKTGGMAMPGHVAHRASTLSFPYAFPQPGRYRLWVQIKTGGKVQTGVFDAAVESP